MTHKDIDGSPIRESFFWKPRQRSDLANCTSAQRNPISPTPLAPAGNALLTRFASLKRRLTANTSGGEARELVSSPEPFYEFHSR